MIKNTSGLSDALVTKIVKFVMPTGVPTVDINIKNSSSVFVGRAYPEGCVEHGNSHPLVVVRIGPDSFFPHDRPRDTENGYRAVHLASREEAAVYLIAHELRHIYQRFNKERLPGARGKYSEKDASLYGIAKLNEWRAQKTKEQIMEVPEDKFGTRFIAGIEPHVVAAVQDMLASGYPKESVYQVITSSVEKALVKLLFLNRESGNGN